MDSQVVLLPTALEPSITSTQQISPGAVPEIPAEILRTIFRMAQSSGQEGAVSHRFRTALAVSHVSQHWQAVAAGLSELWEAVSVTRSIAQTQDIDTLCSILNRSRLSHLHLEIAFQERRIHDSPLDTSTACVEAEFWAKVLGPARKLKRDAILRRCKSLYLSGTYGEIHSVLKVFIYYNSIAWPRERLHWLKVTRHGEVPVIASTVQIIDVARVSAKITHLRSVGVPCSSFPQWSMDTIALEDIELDTKTIRALIAVSGARTLAFRRVTIPAWTDIRPDSFEDGEAYHHQGSPTRLEHLELNAIVKHPQCARLPEAHSLTGFTSFYQDIFIPECVEKLKSVKLVDLNSMAWICLIRVLRSTTGQGLIFPEVETLTLCNAQDAQMEEELRACLPTNFPQADLRISN